MRADLIQAGLRLRVDSALPWLDRMLVEGGPGSWVDVTGREPDVELVVPAGHHPFPLAGWAPVTRDAFSRDGAVVIENACGSGFDLRVEVEPGSDVPKVLVEARFRPPNRERLAARLLRARFHLLTRATLLQYPALWAAGLRGAAPLHAAAITVGSAVPLLVGPGGSGRSTLLLRALADGERACSDNLCASDGRDVHGVVEPVRAEGLPGRRMTHGRREGALPNRVDRLEPDVLVALRRSDTGPTTTQPMTPDEVATVLVAGTYMAGELRRYWPFAATLALGTGHGPVHPPTAAVANALAQRLPAIQVTLGRPPSPSLAELLATTSELAS